MKLLGAEHAKELVQRGVLQAHAHGFQLAGQICRYTNLMFILGAGFDRDPQLPWVQELLGAGKRTMTPDSILSALEAAAIQYLQVVAGPRGHVYRRALQRARAQPLELFPVVVNETSLASWFAKLYPEKARGLDMSAFVAEAHASAKRFHLTHDQPLSLYATLMLLLGSSFADDPAHPWAWRVLNDGGLTSPQDKARALRQSAIEWLDRARRG